AKRWWRADSPDPRRRGRPLDVRRIRRSAGGTFHRHRLRPARLGRYPQPADALRHRRDGRRCGGAGGRPRRPPRPRPCDVAGRRQRQRVDGLLLSSTFRAGTPPMSINPDVFPRLAALRSGLPGTAAEIATYFFPASHIAAHPEVIDIFTGNSRDVAQKQRRAASLARPVENDLAAITASTLVLVGAEDRLIPPAHTLSLAQEIAGARTVRIPGLGHVGTLQDPQAVAREVLAFLRADAINESTTMPGGDHHEGAGGRSPRAVR